jgi:hypothetical protein
MALIKILSKKGQMVEPSNTPQNVADGEET